MVAAAPIQQSLPNDYSAKFSQVCRKNAAISATRVLVSSAQYLDVAGDLSSFAYFTVPQDTVWTNINTLGHNCGTVSKK